MRETEKKEIVNQALEYANRILIFAFMQAELKQFIKADITNLPDGKKYRLTFELIEDEKNDLSRS